MRGVFAKLGGLLAVILLAAFAHSSLAQAQQAQTFTLRPGGQATITFEAYCVEFGKFFPAAITTPNGLAPDRVRAALAYIQQQGYSADQAQALEANFAVWQLAGATRAQGGGPITQEVIQNATTAPADPAGATSLLDAASANQVSLTLDSWGPIGSKVQILSATDNFYGRGTLTVRNTSQQDLTLFMPIGTLFPASEARFQTVGGFATDIQVQNPATPTPAPTATPVATAVPAATPTPVISTLPTTGESGSTPFGLLLFVMVGLLAGGYLLARRAVRR